MFWTFFGFGFSLSHFYSTELSISHKLISTPLNIFDGSKGHYSFENSLYYYIILEEVLIS